MSCLELRRRALVSTQGLPAHLLEHAQRCGCCREFLRTSSELEKALEDAVRVDPPAGLAERILLAHHFSGTATRRRSFAWAAGIAAAVLVAGVLTLNRPSPPSDLALAGIEHVIDEPRSLTTTNAADPGIGAKLLADKGVVAPASLGATRYVSNCIYAGIKVKHLVFDGAMGKVTILVPVAAVTPPPPSMTMAHGMTSVVLPVAAGFITVVSDAGDAAGAFRRASHASAATAGRIGEGRT